ncbi:DNA repair exonuclease [Meredithblackwellia eburnea MCA 4105]
MQPDLEAPPSTITQDKDEDNCIKILLATDNHIGYAETDPVRGTDSINTFREILQLAVANDVDMVLLAGDLFHENRPSRTALFQTMSALREHTMGSRPVSIELISDEGIGIARNATWPGVNYEDENINVGLPIFSIHGNHDDPQGTGAEGALCALDLLSASGLINYFGRLELPANALDTDEALESGLQVKPVLLQKGTTKLALYGMGNIRDERFHYEMKHNRIKMFRPVEDQDEWFNILLVHQNRVPHGPKNYINDSQFGDEVDLVVWGHEHDCINKSVAAPVTGRNYSIVQPGSSIATSLAKGESIPKHVALLKIQGKEFEMDPIRLRSVRPFVWDEVVLAEASEVDNVDLSTKIKVNKFLKEKVNELIDRANAEWDELHEGEDDETPRLLPLIRLRVDWSGNSSAGKPFEISNPQRFGQDFIDKVANPRDIVQFSRKNAGTRKSKVTIDQPDLDDRAGLMDDDDMDGLGDQLKQKVQVSTLVHQFLEAQNLGVLPERAMERAVEEFVEKGDKDALANLLKNALKHERFVIGQTYDPAKEGPEYDDMEAEMEQAKKSAEAKFGVKGKGKQRAEEEEEEDDDDEANLSVDSMAESMSSTGMGKGKGKAKAAPTKKAPVKKATSTAKGKGKQLFESEQDSEEDSDDAPKKKSTSKAAPAKKPPARSAATAAKKKQEAVLEISSDDSSSSDEPQPRKRKR